MHILNTHRLSLHDPNSAAKARFWEKGKKGKGKLLFPPVILGKYRYTMLLPINARCICRRAAVIPAPLELPDSSKIQSAAGTGQVYHRQSCQALQSRLHLTVIRLLMLPLRLHSALVTKVTHVCHVLTGVRRLTGS